MRGKSSFNLYATERIYKEETLMSFYFQQNKNIVKKFSPIDINGERYRLNHETGEITSYKLKEILRSLGCSVRRSKIALKTLLEMNSFDWFCTLTFDKERIDRKNDIAVYDCYQKYINNLSHKFPDLRYICVPERHDIKEDEDYGCLHFHLLIGGVAPSKLGLVDSGKVCCHWATRKKGICSKEFFNKTKHLHELKETDGETIYNITSFAYGLTSASKIVSQERCKNYVAKYVNKAIGGSTAIFKKRFFYSRNLEVPEIVKYLVEADFDNAVNMQYLETLNNNPFIENSKGQPYINDYNVLQIKIDNTIKNNIHKGLLPYELDIEGVFKNNQISIFDKKEN